MEEENIVMSGTREEVADATAAIEEDDEQVILDEIESSRSNISDKSTTNRLASDIIAARSDELAEATPQPDDECPISKPSPSSKLQEMMLERIKSIDAIRTLVEKELEQDSALIAEFTEQVVALESELSRKEHDIQVLTNTNEQMQIEMDQLKTKADGYAEELAALTAQIDALVDQNTQLESQNEDLIAIQTSVEPLKARNEQMEEIITSITTSLRDAKKCLEKELKYTAALEKDKAHSAQHAAQLAADHKFEIDAYKKRLDEANQGQTHLRKEMDELRKQLCREQLNNTKMTTVRNNLTAAEESIARLNAEKQLLCEEVARAKHDNEEMVREMENKKAQADPVKALQKELETLRMTLGEAQMENAQLIGLQGEQH